MDNNLFQRLKELIEGNQAIGIVLPANPAFDTAAAGLGMYLSLVQMKKSASIVCPTDVTVGVSSLVGVDKIQKSFGGGSGDLVVSFPYKDGEIEKVSYNVDGGKLQIVVKAGAQGLSFSQSDVTFQQGGNGAAPSLLFFIGVADMQAAGYTKTPGTTVVNIDNKSNNTKYGDVVHVDGRFSSISEEVADFLTLLEPQIELDVDTSQNLLSGILSATNDFQNGQGSYLAFEMAGILMKKGATRSGTPAAQVSMPAANYFPPAPNAAGQPAQQPPAQAPQAPVFEQSAQSAQSAPVIPTPNLGSMFGTSTPVTDVQSGTMQSPTSPAPIQQVPVQPVQPQQNAQPPADWLTPKVYKGSTVV